MKKKKKKKKKKHNKTKQPNPIITTTTTKAHIEQDGIEKTPSIGGEGIRKKGAERAQA